MTFAERLRELRERAGMTQESLAVAAGMSVSAIRNYEQGVREPYWRGLFQLADALSVDCRAFADCVPSNGAPAAPRGRPKKTPAKRKGKRS